MGAYDPPKSKYNCDDYIQIYNYSDKAIYFQLSCDSLNISKLVQLFYIQIGSSFDGETYKIDTSIQIINRSPNRVPAFTKIEYNHISVPPRNSNLWHKFAKKCDSETIKIYFFSEETMRANTWTTIVYKQLFEQKLELTVNDIEEMDWLIRYDPSLRQVELH